MVSTEEQLKNAERKTPSPMPKVGRYTGEVVYIYAFDVAYEMTRQPVRGQPFQGRGHLLFERRGRMRGVLDFQRILATLGPHHARAAQELRRGSGVERGGHDYQAQVRT